MGGEKRIEKFRVQDKQSSVILGGNVKCIYYHGSWKKRKYESPILAQCQVQNEHLLNGITALSLCIYFCLPELSPLLVVTGKHLYFPNSLLVECSLGI